MAEIIETKPSEHALLELGVKSWPIWTCEASVFDWDYTQSETCLVLEGEVTVTDRPEGAVSVSFGPGDLVGIQHPSGHQQITRLPGHETAVRNLVESGVHVRRLPPAAFLSRMARPHHHLRSVQVPERQPGSYRWRWRPGSDGHAARHPR